MRRSRSLLSGLSIIALLLTSSAALPIAFAAPATAVTTFKSNAPTYVGSPAAFLTGPTVTSPFGASTPQRQALVSGAASSNVIPAQNPKPLVAKDLADGDPPSLSSTVPPTVNCQSPVGGCANINLGSGGAKSNPYALSAVSDNSQFGGVVEPPDQGLCAGNGYVMEVENQGELQVYNSKLAPVSGVVSLDSVMGLTALGWSSGGDIMCGYDGGNGGHWFITEIVSASTEASGGPFNGCFAGILDTCYEGIAVSTTNDPMGSYNVYFLNANTVNSDPGQGYLLNDFAKTATTNDAFLIFYDEFNQNPSTFPACPAYGCLGFNGAQEFAFDKSALELGLSSSSPRFTVAYENMGTASNLYPIPANGGYQPAAASCFSGTFAGQICWYQVIPAQSPGSSQYDYGSGGSGFMLATLDFLGAGDNRVAAFDWTGLSNLNSYGCSSCRGISFGGQLLTGLATYMDEGAPCLVNSGISSFCGLAPQKTGPTPLGGNCSIISGQTASPCPESGIATNGDGVTQVSYAQGELWTAVSTVVNQTFSQAGHGHRTSSELHIGATYWVITTGGPGPLASSSSASFPSPFPPTFSIEDQGYVSPAHEDIEFPSVAADDSGGAVMAFTLSGDGGPTAASGGGFYPSTAYGRLIEGRGLVGNAVYVADLGKSPQDGFSEYLGYSPSSGSLGTRPRWGDYSAAIYVPQHNGPGLTYFATEYIQYPNCSGPSFLNDPTCGGTRAPFANWGSSINYVGP